MPDTIHPLVRRGLAVVGTVAVSAAVLGATACDSAPTAPHGVKASASATVGKGGPARRGGYNVVAD